MKLKIFFSSLTIILLSIIINTIKLGANKNESPYIEDIRSNSSLLENNFIHSPIYLIDGTERSWCEGRNSNGIGESVIIDWNKEILIDHLYIKNGFGLTKYYKFNNRVKELLVQIHEKGVFGFTDVGLIKLKDTLDIQKIALPKKIRTKTLKLIIRSVYKGKKNNDTCLAEISLKPLLVKKYYKKIGIIKKAYNIKKKRISFILYPNGKIKDNGTVHISQCDTYFVKGGWGETNDGRIFINTIRKIRENCADMSATDEGDWMLFDINYILDDRNTK